MYLIFCDVLFLIAPCIVLGQWPEGVPVPSPPEQPPWGLSAPAAVLLSANATAPAPAPAAATAREAPEPAVPRLARPKEVPEAVLALLAGGPELSACLVTRRVALAAVPPATYRPQRSSAGYASNKRALGVLLAGYDHPFFVEGPGPMGYDCQSTVTSNRQCRNIFEVVTQNSTTQSSHFLMLLFVEQPFEMTPFVRTTRLIPNRRLPAEFRLQSVAVWFAVNSHASRAAEDEGGRRGEEAWPEGEAFYERRRGPKSRAKPPPPPRQWQLWVEPVGLWHASHCEGRAVKGAMVCEDGWAAEAKVFAAMDGVDSRTRPPGSDLGTHGGGRGTCTPRSRHSAFAKFGGALAAFRVPLESVDDVLFLTSDTRGTDIGNQKEKRCSAVSNVARRLWVWVGESADWVQAAAANCSDMSTLQAMQVPFVVQQGAASAHFTYYVPPAPVLALGLAFALLGVLVVAAATSPPASPPASAAALARRPAVHRSRRLQAVRGAGASAAK